MEPWAGKTPPGDGGVFWREAILRNIRAARRIIDAHRPDRVITFGGDCLVSQAPFAYLNERYDGRIGIIWIDAHPDVTTPKDFNHAHAMVLGNLLGDGEPLTAREVKRHYVPDQVLLVGVDGVLPHERETIDRFGIKTVPSKDVIGKSGAVTEWMRAGRFERVAVHLDLDVPDPAFFPSLLFRNPDEASPIEAEQGKLGLRDVAALLRDIAAHADVVGMSFAEYMPWDALNLKTMPAGLPFMR